ncbi:MAG: 6-bladed beta-propeller [Bacteroidales bacterium]
MKTNTYFIRIVMLLSISLVVAFSCTTKETGVTGTLIIKAEDAVMPGQVMKLSDIAKSVKYIPLETNQKSMLGEIRHVKYEHGKIYVSDNTGSIKVFDGNGKFLSSFNRTGRGPEEYVDIAAFSPEEGGKISVLSNDGVFFLYDEHGNFIKKDEINSQEERMTYWDYTKLGDNTLVTAYNFTFKEDSPIVMNYYFVCDDSLNVISQDSREQENAMRISRNNGQIAAISITLTPFFVSKFQNSARLYYPDRDTIFSLDQYGTLSDAFVFEQGKYAVNKDDMDNFVPSQERGYVTLQPPFFETDQFVLFSFNAGKNAPELYQSEMVSADGKETTSYDTYTYAMLEKKSGSLKPLARPQEGKKGFLDDLEGGVPFWPTAISSEGNLIAYKQAYKIIDAALQGNASKNLSEIASRLGEDDNPVMIVVDLKE